MSNGTIVFFSVPDSLIERRFSNNFRLDPSILLPVESQSAENGIDPEKISLETIISGMLRILSTDRAWLEEEVQAEVPAEVPMEIPPEWLDYYRNFVLAAKPEIYQEFTCASIVKAENGDYDLALEISAALEGLFPVSPGVLLNKAIILESRAAALEKAGKPVERENSETLDAFEAALAVEQVLPDTLFNAAFFFMRIKDFACARACLSRFVSMAEENPEEIPVEKKRQARKIIKSLGGLDDPDFREAYDSVNRGEAEAALAKIRGFLEKCPKVWNGWFVLGWALRQLGRFKDALQSFEKALELGGGGIDLFNEMAICLMELGDLKAARRELEQALHEEPENTKIISNLGVLAMKAGKSDDAKAFFRTVLELDPDDEMAKHYLKEL